MKTKFLSLARNQLDSQFGQLKQLDWRGAPQKGWIRAIRDSLGMSARQLAKRMQVSQPRITSIEKAEVSDAITLRTLRRAAEALDCTLLYAVVPNSSLEEMTRKQATSLAKERLFRVGHTMRLEDQEVSEQTSKSQLESMIDEILRNQPRSLWS